MLPEGMQAEAFLFVRRKPTPVLGVVWTKCEVADLKQRQKIFKMDHACLTILSRSQECSCAGSAQWQLEGVGLWGVKDGGQAERLACAVCSYASAPPGRSRPQCRIHPAS